LTEAPPGGILVQVSLRSTAEPAFTTSEILKPYVPRLVIDWLRETPDLTHRRLDATLVFVDISGFTKLTERLSRKGKIGAEEMNDILDECFTELLSVAYEYGADVIKWGGDAVLLLFADDAHPARACRAAAEMQQTMSTVGLLQTSSGRVTLSMSIGISSALFDFFLVGDLHRELIVAGPAATATVSLEGAARSREVVIGAATAEALDPSCIGKPRGPGFLLRRPPDVRSERSVAIEDVSDVDLRRCLPLDVCEHLLGGGGEAEHRPMIPAFVQFLGVDDLLVRDGPDALADTLEICLTSLQSIAHEHRVAIFDTDIAANGVKVMLMAGAPKATGNDAERMLRAMRAVLDARTPLPARIGIAWGRIFTGDFGPPYRRTYSVKGDAVNLAARLMARAEPSQLLATDGVLRRSRTGFETRALEPFTAKGKAEPVIAFEVGSAVAFQARGQDTETPFVGRQHELAVLTEAFESACGSRGRVVELVAGAGMGKSRLIAEISSRAAWGRTVSGHGDQYERATPYFGFRSLFRDLLGIEADDEARLREAIVRVAPHLAPWLPLVATLLGLSLEETAETAALDERLRKERLEQAVVELLGILLDSVTLLVFEDVHWLDEASADLLRRVVRQTSERPWLVIVARREEPGDFRVPDDVDHVVLALQPLEVEDAGALVHAATDEEPLPPHDVVALARRAGGNPLFLAELLAVARADGGVAELPDSVEAVLMAEIDRLDPVDRRMLRAAAVVGTFFTPELVAASLDAQVDPAVWSRLSHYITETDTGEFRFRHALARDVAYEGLPYRRRSELHARIGTALETRTAHPEDEAELLSLHFFHAYDYEGAWRYAWIAGDRAQSLYANMDAVALYERALAAGRHIDAVSTDELATVSEALGDVAERAGDYRRAETAFRVARRLRVGNPLDEARLLQKQAWIPERLGRYSTALRWIGRAQRLIEGIEGAQAAHRRAHLNALRASIRYHQGHYRDVIRWCHRAIAEAELSGAKDALALAYCFLDYAYVALGRVSEACYSPLALSIYEELGDLQRQATVQNDMGAFAYWQGRWDDALRLYEQARLLREQVGNPVYAADCQLNIAEIFLDRGHLDRVEPLVVEALRVYRAAGFKARVALSKRHLGKLAAYSGRVDEARALFEEARAIFVEVGFSSEVNDTDGRMAECLLLETDGTAALGLLETTLGRAERTGGAELPMLRRLRGHALALVGEPDLAWGAFREALDSARPRGMAFEVALTLDALTRLGGSTQLAAERDGILDRLGVRQLPAIPL
jgi:class 3 adenylate cyclase/tetratricopeptide (TPR) repeat protein